MANALVFVTGDKAVDAVLAEFEAKFQRKYGRKAAREAAKFVHEDFKTLAPEDTGAMIAASSVRTAPKSKSYAFGMMIHIDREKLFAHAEGAGVTISIDKKRGGGKFYWPAVIEFGDHDTEAQKPMRAALYGNEAAVRQVFMESLKRQIAETKPVIAA